ncbi:MAG: UbiA family prenyltransferase, partial [Candidatus Bathyarchaeia archaeon]
MSYWSKKLRLSAFKSLIELTIPSASIISAIVSIAGAFMTKSFGFYLTIFAIGPVFFLSSCGFNTLNAITDLEADRVSRPSRPLPSTRISSKAAIKFLIFLYFLYFLLLAFLASLQPSRVTILLIIGDLVLTFFYSIPPRLKNFPLLSNIIVGLHYSMLPMLSGWSLFKPFYEAPFSIVLVVTLLASGVNILEDFEDIEGDKFTNTRTLPILLGKKFTIAVLTSFYSIALIIGVLNWLSSHSFYWIMIFPLEAALILINLGLINTEL